MLPPFSFVPISGRFGERVETAGGAGPRAEKVKAARSFSLPLAKRITLRQRCSQRNDTLDIWIYLDYIIN